MFQFTWHAPLWVLIAGGLLSACASTPASDAPAVASATRVGPVKLNVDGAVPLLHTRGDPLLASRVGVGSSRDLWRYEARYTVEPGDVFAEQAATPGGAAPQRFGGHGVGQNLQMRIPTAGYGPVALRLSSEAREQWTTGGNTVAHQRQAANLQWSPRLAKLELQWVGNDGAIDGQLALGCEMRGTVQVPLPAEESEVSRVLRFSGRDCRVLAPPASGYRALGAEAWGMGLAWQHAGRETEVLVSVIDPAWKSVVDRQNIDASYEFGVRHREDYEQWTANTRLAMRYATAWDLAAPKDHLGYYQSDSEAYWSASASLTRQLSAVSLSAGWTHGGDPMWFVPEIGQRRHGLNMRLDLSRAVAPFVPDVAPRVAMHWNWSQARSRTDAVSGNSVFGLNMAVAW